MSFTVNTYKKIITVLIIAVLVVSALIFQTVNPGMFLGDSTQNNNLKGLDISGHNPALNRLGTEFGYSYVDAQQKHYTKDVSDKKVDLLFPHPENMNAFLRQDFVYRRDIAQSQLSSENRQKIQNEYREATNKWHQNIVNSVKKYVEEQKFYGCDPDQLYYDDLNATVRHRDPLEISFIKREEKGMGINFTDKVGSTVWDPPKIAFDNRGKFRSIYINGLSVRMPHKENSYSPTVFNIDDPTIPFIETYNKPNEPAINKRDACKFQFRMIPSIFPTKDAKPEHPNNEVDVAIEMWAEFCNQSVKDSDNEKFPIIECRSQLQRVNYKIPELDTIEEESMQKDNAVDLQSEIPEKLTLKATWGPLPIKDSLTVYYPVKPDTCRIDANVILGQFDSLDEVTRKDLIDYAITNLEVEDIGNVLGVNSGSSKRVLAEIDDINKKLKEALDCIADPQFIYSKIVKIQDCNFQINTLTDFYLKLKGDLENISFIQTPAIEITDDLYKQNNKRLEEIASEIRKLAKDLEPYEKAVVELNFILELSKVRLPLNGKAPFFADVNLSDNELSMQSVVEKSFHESAKKMIELIKERDKNLLQYEKIDPEIRNFEKIYLNNPDQDLKREIDSRYEIWKKLIDENLAINNDISKERNVIQKDIAEEKKDINFINDQLDVLKNEKKEIEKQQKLFEEGRIQEFRDEHELANDPLIQSFTKLKLLKIGQDQCQYETVDCDDLIAEVEDLGFQHTELIMEQKAYFKDDDSDIKRKKEIIKEFIDLENDIFEDNFLAHKESCEAVKTMVDEIKVILKEFEKQKPYFEYKKQKDAQKKIDELPEQKTIDHLLQVFEDAARKEGDAMIQGFKGVAENIAEGFGQQVNWVNNALIDNFSHVKNPTVVDQLLAESYRQWYDARIEITKFFANSLEYDRPAMQALQDSLQQSGQLFSDSIYGSIEQGALNLGDNFLNALQESVEAINSSTQVYQHYSNAFENQIDIQNDIQSYGNNAHYDYISLLIKVAHAQSNCADCSYNSPIEFFNYHIFLLEKEKSNLIGIQSLVEVIDPDLDVTESIKVLQKEIDDAYSAIDRLVSLQNECQQKRAEGDCSNIEVTEPPTETEKNNDPDGETEEPTPETKDPQPIETAKDSCDCSANQAQFKEWEGKLNNWRNEVGKSRVNIEGAFKKLQETPGDTQSIESLQNAINGLVDVYERQQNASGEYKEAYENYKNCIGDTIQKIQIDQCGTGQQQAFLRNILIPRANAQEIVVCPNCGFFSDTVNTLTAQLNGLQAVLTNLLEIDDSVELDRVDEIIANMQNDITDVQTRLNDALAQEQNCFTDVNQLKNDGQCIDPKKDGGRIEDARCNQICGIDLYAALQKESLEMTKKLHTYVQDELIPNMQNESLRAAALNEIDSLMQRLDKKYELLISPSTERNLMACLATQSQAIYNGLCFDQNRCDACAKIQRFSNIFILEKAELRKATSQLLKSFVLSVDTLRGEESKNIERSVKALESYIQQLVPQLVERKELQNMIQGMVDECQQGVGELEQYNQCRVEQSIQ